MRSRSDVLTRLVKLSAQLEKYSALDPEEYSEYCTILTTQMKEIEWVLMMRESLL